MSRNNAVTTDECTRPSSSDVNDALVISLSVIGSLALAGAAIGAAVVYKKKKTQIEHFT